ncbi:MAG: hypothetical protein V4615_04875 [Bacteroidota bacterium]
MNTLFTNHLSPIQYHRINPANLPQFMSKHMDRFPFVDTIKEWEQFTRYEQIFYTLDSIRQQFTTNYGPLSLSLVDKDDAVFYGGNFQQKQQNKYEPETFVYEHDLALNVYEPGIYFLKLECGSPVNLTLISEPIIISNKVKNTLLLGYSHHAYYGGIIFQTGFSPYLRLPATLRLKTPSSKDTLFEDQPLNMTMIERRPFDVWELLIGGATGIPDYLIRKLNHIFGCSTLSIDGILYTIAEGAKWEERRQERFPKRGWSIDLREKYNRAANVYENDDLLQGQIAVVANVDSKGFGADDSGGSIYQILDLS